MRVVVPEGGIQFDGLSFHSGTYEIDDNYFLRRLKEAGAVVTSNEDGGVMVADMLKAKAQFPPPPAAGGNIIDADKLNGRVPVMDLDDQNKNEDEHATGSTLGSEGPSRPAAGRHERRREAQGRSRRR